MARSKKRSSKNGGDVAGGNGAAADEPDVVGSEAAYDEFLPEALEYEGIVMVMRADPRLALHNVQIGLDAIKPYEDQLKVELPKLNRKRIGQLARIALALGFAASQVDRKAGSSKKVRGLLRTAYALRDTMMTIAEGLAKVGLLPKAAVARIRRGKGAFDVADDLIQLAALFRKHAKALKGKNPLSVKDLAEAARLGTELTGLLRPKASVKAKDVDQEVEDAADVRDRLWTLLIEGHRELRRAGMWIWVDDVDEHVPALQSRVVVRVAVEKNKKPQSTLPVDRGDG